MVIKMKLFSGDDTFVNPEAVTMILPDYYYYFGSKAEDGTMPIVSNKVQLKFIGGNGTIVAGDIKEINKIFVFSEIDLATGAKGYINTKTIAEIMPWHDTFGKIIEGQTLIKIIGGNEGNKYGAGSIIVNGNPKDVQQMLFEPNFTTR